VSSSLSTRAPRGGRARHLLAAGLALALGVGAVQVGAPASASGPGSATAAGHQRAAIGTVYEAENQTLTGVTAQTEHAGYTGTGYVGGFGATGNSVLATVTAETTATHDLYVRYANGGTSKTLSLVVNGTARQITLPGTGGWANYASVATRIDLTAGANSVELRRNATDSGSLNVDHLKVVPQIGPRYEAEAAALTGGAAASTEHAGFTGTGFVGGFGNVGATATFTVQADTAGDSPAVLRYAAGPNPFNGAKRVTLLVNGAAQPIILPGFNSWKDWGEFSLSLPLRAGANEVAIRYAAGDDGNVNLDHLDVGAPVPPTCGSTIEAGDTFDGTELDRCRWTTVLNESTDGYRVADGALQIDARPGDLSGGVTNARNVILQAAPATDAWMTETTVSLDGTDDYLQAGLVVWGNSASFGKITVMRTPAAGWTVELGRVTAGRLEYTDSAALPEGAQNDVRLRLWSDAGRLRGSYSLDDGATWTVVGTGYATDGLANPLVGLAAFNGTGAETARFDRFTVSAPVRVESTVTVSATPASVEVGQPASVAVQVEAPGATPTGEVTLREGDEVVGTAELSKGAATFEVGPYTGAGTRTFTATYAGDTAVAGSTGTGSLVVTAVPDPEPVASTVTVSADPGSVPVGETSTITVKVAAQGATPTGRVTLREGDEVLGTASLSQGVAMFQGGPYATAGTHTFTATYAGNTTVAGSSGTGSLVVTAAPVASTVTVSVDPGSVEVGKTATMHVEVTAEGTTPTGAVSLFEDGQRLYTTSLSDGRAMFVLGGYGTPGTRTFTVTYQGSDTVAGSSGTGSLVVTDPVPEPVTSRVDVFADPDGVKVGATSTIIVKVAADSAVTPTGKVTLREGDVFLGSTSLDGGSATFVVGPYATPGTRTYTATYDGNETTAGSTGTGSLVVKAEPVASKVAVSASPSTVLVGQRADVTVTVTAADVTPTGEVTLRDNGRVVATRTLSGGRTTFPVGPYYGAATHTLTAAYAGSTSVSAGTGSTKLVVKAKPVISVPSKVVNATANRSTGLVKMTCTPAGVRCTGTAELRAGGHLLGRGRVSVTGGRTSIVQIALTARARTLLAKQSRVRANLTVSVSGGSTKKVLVTLTR
jgi:hypothetical protein